jgi:hypothetical protein
MSLKTSIGIAVDAGSGKKTCVAKRGTRGSTLRNCSESPPKPLGRSRACRELAEGGLNNVFKLVMDNERVVIARIPNPNVRRVAIVTASEVATMEFVCIRRLNSFGISLSQGKKGQFWVFRYLECCCDVEQIRVPSSLLTFSWSTPKTHNLANSGKTWRSTRSTPSLTR